jgi:uncharacterized Ntn-hydrolase superfamily protein
MGNSTVCNAIAHSFEHNLDLSFEERLVCSLEAAQEAGGDIRGKQSVALLVVSPNLFPNEWAGRLIDI